MGDEQPLARVMAVDDEPAIRRLIAVALERAGFAVEEVADGADAIARVNADPPDVVILDIAMQPLSGWEVLRGIRENHRMPVIMLSAYDAETDRVRGLDLGADDFVGKPFSPRELAARVRSVLRRAGSTAVGILAGPVELLPHSRVATLSGAPVDLTPREFDLLLFLGRHPDRAFSREELLAEVWGTTPGEQDLSTVTEHMRRLRLKVEPNPAEPTVLLTVRGIGYRLAT